ncbi:MAG: CvpA family protein [Alphaproteobacteria bacterium]|nr:CvpA family protein [Alphaproteobacteria bacterium]
MTAWDVFSVLILLASGAAGWIRGGTRELLTLLSFVLAAFIALIALPLSAPVGKAMIDPDWAGTLLAALATFLLVYFGVRIVGSTLSRRAQAHPHLGGIDRVFGIVVGLTRALVLLGAIHLVVVAAMPGERTPRWLGEASLYSVSAGAARAIQFVLPGIGRGADALAPVVNSSVRQGFSGEDALPKTQTGPNSPDTAR